MAKIKKFRGKSRIYTKFGSTSEQVTVISKKDRERAKELNAEISDETASGRYSDSFGISFKEGEFVIDFFKTEQGKAKLHTRMVMPPAAVKRLAGAIKKCL